MKQITLFTFLGFVFLLTLIGCTNNKQSVQKHISMVNEKQNSLQQLPIEWKEINHANYWGHPDFFKTPYRFANIKFSYPSNWIFECCLDRSDGSGHTLYTNSEKNIVAVSFFDYTLYGCPNDNKSCSIIEGIGKTPKEKYNDIIEQISANADIKPKKYLKNLDTEIFVYNTTNKNGQNVESYLIQTDKNVIKLSFIDQDKKFIETFLDKVEKD